MPWGLPRPALLEGLPPKDRPVGGAASRPPRSGASAAEAVRIRKPAVRDEEAVASGAPRRAGRRLP
ncbi:hypothetical protein GCM10010266_31140 [Streptomyces griseomycini]|nr:hypothetical protein GCM10010266_31140 [Streptomyces griseomycini]GGR20904.1 hypothetical protein GCM10015536_28130 [Streptomyces griseomycini]